MHISSASLFFPAPPAAPGPAGGTGVQPGKAARMCHERGLAQGDVAPVSVTCWEHTIPSRGPTDQGLQGYRVSSLLCPRYVAVTGVAKRLIQTVSGGRHSVAHAQPAGRKYIFPPCMRARGARRAPARLPPGCRGQRSNLGGFYGTAAVWHRTTLRTAQRCCS